MFCGQESAGVLALKVLLGSSHRVVGVFTSGNASAIGGSGVHKLAEQEGLTIFPAEFVRDGRAVEALGPQQVDIVLNVHSLYLVHESLLGLPSIGAFNLHPGPLPRLAGLNSISWTIFLGEKRHGVTLHHMTHGIDEGPIAYQTLFDLQETDTPVSIMSRCAKEGAAIVERLLKDVVADRESIPRIEQDFSKRDYYGRKAPNKGWIDWTWPAVRVANFIRACDYHPFPSPWGRPKALLAGREVSIGSGVITGDKCGEAPGTIVGAEDGDVRVACSDAWIVVSRFRTDDGRLDSDELLKLDRYFETGAPPT